MSAIFAENYKKDESTLSESVVETAKAKFKQHKAIIIKGPRKCGKTTLAALLTSIYQPGEFLIIYKADDMKYISLDKVCLVVVEDFAGKYRYDNVGASDWMRAFDMLHSLVKAGKLNVVLTCKDTFLAECKKDFEDHPIFDNPVQMEESDIRIKQEEDENVTGNLMPFNYNERGRFVIKLLETNKRHRFVGSSNPYSLWTSRFYSRKRYAEDFIEENFTPASSLRVFDIAKTQQYVQDFDDMIIHGKPPLYV